MGVDQRVRHVLCLTMLSMSAVAAVTASSGLTATAAGRTLVKRTPRGVHLSHARAEQRARHARAVGVRRRASAVPRSAGRVWKPGEADASGPAISEAQAVAAPGAAPLPPNFPGPSPWLAYISDVDPGSAIQFASANTGWRVDGIDPAPSIDNNLADGPEGAQVTWPGTDVSATADGGATWNVIHADDQGIWGIDLLSEKVGWIVGVRSLVGTTDGGTSWTTLGEPAQPLVTVQFATPTVGYGLTDTGQLEATSDGGTSWQTQTAPAAVSMCFSSASVGYLADETGDVFETNDGGATWTESYASTVPALYAQVWSQLACDGSSATEAIKVTSQMLSAPAYLVVQQPTGDPGWNTLSTNSSGGPSLVTGTPDSTSLGDVDSVASGDGRTLVGAIPYRGFAPGLVSSHDSPAPGPGASTAYPSIPASSSINPLIVPPTGYVNVIGTAIQGQSAWAYVVDSAVAGSNSPVFNAIVLRSQDGGQTWATASDSGPQRQPAGGA